MEVPLLTVVRRWWWYLTVMVILMILVVRGDLFLFEVPFLFTQNKEIRSVPESLEYFRRGWISESDFVLMYIVVI